MLNNDTFVLFAKYRKTGTRIKQTNEYSAFGIRNTVYLYLELVGISKYTE